MAIAGNCINTKAGFRATAGTAGTTFHGWVQTAPAAVSVAPASGTGLSQTFTWTASSPAGYESVAEVCGLFNTMITEVNGCYLRYNRASHLLFLADNGASYWMGGFAPGSAQTVENSQCKIYGTGASVSGAGPQLAVVKNASGNVVDLGAFGFQIDNNAAGSETGSFYLGAATGNSALVLRMVLKSNGRVGIGTMNPQHLLPVNGVIGPKT